MRWWNVAIVLKNTLLNNSLQMDRYDSRQTLADSFCVVTKLNWTPIKFLFMFSYVGGLLALLSLPNFFLRHARLHHQVAHADLQIFRFQNWYKAVAQPFPVLRRTANRQFLWKLLRWRASGTFLASHSCSFIKIVLFSGHMDLKTRSFEVQRYVTHFKMEILKTFYFHAQFYYKQEW